MLREFAAIVLVTASVASCGGDSPGATELDRDAAIAAALDVRADGCGPRVDFGSGAMIDERLAVTAAHVVAGASDVSVTDTSGRSSTAFVVHFDPDLDVALLFLDTEVGAPIELRELGASAAESGVVVLPRWVGDELTLEVGDVTVLRSVDIATTDIYRENDVTRPGFEIEGSIDPGDSGSLVVLPGGGVGIVWARSNQRSRRAWAVDLPDAIVDSTLRERLVEPVDVGPCIG